MWRPGARRISPEALREMIAAGELAVAWRDEKVVGCRIVLVIEATI